MQFNAVGTVWPKSPPVSNTERQRRFRQRNPGYYGRIKAKERAASKAAVAPRPAVVDGTVEILFAYLKMPLMLPAPVEPIEIPGVTTVRLRDSITAPMMVETRLRDAA